MVKVDVLYLNLVRGQVQLFGYKWFLTLFYDLEAVLDLASSLDLFAVPGPSRADRGAAAS